MTNFGSPVRTSTGRVNLCPNPSFEGGTTVASANAGYPGAVSLAVNTNAANALRGSNSLQLTGTSASGAVVWFHAPGTGSQPIAVSGNTTYSFSFWVKCTTAARNWSASMVFYSAGYGSLATVTGTATPTSTTGFTQVSFTTTSPATAAWAALRAVSATNAVGEVFYIDGLMLEPTAAPSAGYFDGSSDSGRWRGTAHNSISESYGGDYGTNILQNVGTPVRGTDAVNKTYCDTVLTSGARATSLSQRLNLITNPSFTSGAVTGWSVVNATGTVAYNGTDSFSGTGSMTIGTTTAAAAGAVGITVSPAAATTAYTLTFYVKPGSIATSGSIQAKIEWYNASNAVISTSTGSSVGVPNGYPWVRYSYTAPSPATTVKAVVQIFSTGTVVTDTHVVDAVLFEAASSAGTYFDGTSANGRWRGTAHLSVSEIISFDANNTAVINVAAPTAGNDAANKSYVDAAVAGGSGAALDADLVTIGNLAPPDTYILQRKAGAWDASSPATVKTDLSLVKADVGLSNVDNTSDVDKPVSTAQAAAISTVTTTANNAASAAASATTTANTANSTANTALTTANTAISNADAASDAADAATAAAASAATTANAASTTANAASTAAASATTTANAASTAAASATTTANAASTAAASATTTANNATTTANAATTTANNATTAAASATTTANAASALSSDVAILTLMGVY